MADGQLNIRVDDKLKREFIEKARHNGTTATDVLVEYMRQYIALPHQKTEAEKIEELERKLAKVDELARVDEELAIRLSRVEQVLGEFAA
ncbi:hypothetical protein WA1_16755 [Scytonema hofmannii PCC 7110]|uniref:CopG family transcriptional regulator n=1 Tax=Scytonema hofmannii PCC 7110 TaxID=128403 RepID=A0A139XAH8_9CYAN|nr:hypothetical protein [Scytonema hofmannii]KYC41689.1 hypothetical protein WA1_16755 [Scytonema hofmannii PCC 7110]